MSHGNAPTKAHRLEERLRERFAVRFCLNRPFHASVYHSVGPGCVGVYVAPIDGLPVDLVQPG